MNIPQLSGPGRSRSLLIYGALAVACSGSPSTGAAPSAQASGGSGAAGAPAGALGGGGSVEGGAAQTAGRAGAAQPAGGAGATGVSATGGSGTGGGGASPSSAGRGGAPAGIGGALSGAGGALTGAGGALTGTSGTSAGGAAGGPGFPPLPANVTLHVAGDSTAAIFPATDPTKRVGWASVAAQFFAAGATVDDAAQSGRSSKSFIDEGLWTSLKAKIHPGDYVFIEFGHNDEKTDDPARYTDPTTTFRSYLKTYVSETKAAGGLAVLLTPISRRKFTGDKVSPTHGAYPAAVIAVGSETGTPVIDMTDKTRIWLEALGPTATIPFFATGDDTHLSALGAPEVAKLALQGVRELQLPLAARLLPQ